MYPIGISLSGGGARGIAHIGVLQALLEHDIRPQVFSGSSAGAIVGLFYAAGYSPAEIMDVVKKSSLFKILSFGTTGLTSGLSDLSYLEKLIVEKIPHNRFDQLSMPFYAAVSNITDGCCEYLNTGLLSEVVVASCSIPLVFKPVKFNNKTYIDGGFFDNLPVKPIRPLSEKLIAVNVNPSKFGNDPNHVLSIGQRCFDLSIWRNTAEQISQADVFIDVEEAAKYRLIDVARADNLYKAGYEKTMTQMSEILSVLKQRELVINNG